VKKQTCPTEEFMRRAIELACRPKNSVLPNPLVGAVLTYRNTIIGQGFHRGPGHPHAEVEAIRDAERNSFRSFGQSCLYVSLEPCCHLDKRTPPCIPLILEEKIPQVIIAHRDPNKKVSGQGILQLKKAGVKVTEGYLEEEAALINQAYIKNQKHKLPYVSLKLAMTFDGKLANDKGDAHWITGPLARHQVHEQRAQADAIAIGSATIKMDDPQLNARLNKKSFKKKIVIFGAVKSLEKRKVTKANGLENIIIFSKMQKDLKAVLRKLYREHSIQHLYIEGGPNLASQFLEQKLVDECHLYYGRGFLGGKGVYSLGRSWGLKSMAESVKFQPQDAEILENDLHIYGRINVYWPHSKSRKA